jgi:aquaporin Z
MGTFFVTATAIGVDIFYYTGEHIDFASRWLARGFITAAAIYAFSEISGAHINPAVTVGFVLRRIFPPAMAAGQVVATIAEAILTFAVMLVILMTAQEQPAVGKQAALAVGFVVAACGFAAGPISGASMNPARTIAPQLLAGTFGNIWIYVAGPLAGAALAVGAHSWLSGPPSKGARKAARGR